MNTKEDLERIKKHVHELPEFHQTPLLLWISQIADKLDEYHRLLEEKDAAIKRLIKRINRIAEKLDEYQRLIEEKDAAIKRLIEKGE